MTIEGLTKYLEESGLGDRIEHIKPGDAFGVEIPIDEEKGKTLKFWLSMDMDGEDKYLELDFEGMIHLRVCTDMEKLETWLNNSGFIELGELAVDQLPDTEKDEGKE